MEQGAACHFTTAAGRGLAISHRGRVMTVSTDRLDRRGVCGKVARMKLLKVVLASLVLASFAIIQGSAAVAASGYTLYGDAMAVHPGHASDTAIQLRSDADPGWGGIDFDTTAGMTLNQLQNLSTDYMFTAGSCGGGSPRFQINVDGHNIFVYIGPPPNYTGCAANVWLTTGDLLESALFVDTSQLPLGTFYDTWASALAKYGTHEITGIHLVSEGSWQDFESSPGPFKNQGDCVSYFATGGKNKASD